MGMAPDEMGGSVLDPNTARVRQGAQIGFPVGTALQMLPFFGPAKTGAMAVGRAGERLAERAVPQIMERGGMGAEMLQGMSRNTVSPLDVYHGSPHKFDRFDASKIGTGEGNQSYGYGLYFAENPAVSESYQKMISTGKQLDPLSKQAKKFVKENMIGGADNDAILKAAAASKNQAARWDLEDVKRGIPASRNDYVNAMDEVQEFLRKNPIAPNDGSLYKVDLPDEQIANMLDWDKPLSEQHPQVQAVFNNIPRFKDPYIASKSTAGEAYGELSGILGGREKAAEALRQAGIPGIKYLDEGSRGASGKGKWKLKFLGGEEKIYDFKPDDDVLKMMNATAEPYGTRNFVTFPGEEQNLTILERNGQPSQNRLNSFIK